MMQPADPSRLLWMKNVNHPEVGHWAYFNSDGEDPPVPAPPTQRDFRMHWPTAKPKAASRPKLGDLMLLCQHGRTTHLVRFLDSGPLEDKLTPSYPWRRSVEAIWYADPASDGPRQEVVLGFDPVFVNGDSRRIDNCAGYRNSNWPRIGALPALQQHVVAFLSGWSPT